MCVKFNLILIVIQILKVSGNRQIKLYETLLERMPNMQDQITVGDIDSKALALSVLNYVNDIKFILLWNANDVRNKWLRERLGVGQIKFWKWKCPQSNCFMVNNETFFSNISAYDAILFHGPQILTQSYQLLPKTRSQLQQYVFVSAESASRLKICNERFNRFFNVTFTYKFNSNVLLNYILIRNKKGQTVGPKEKMHWIKLKDMTPLAMKFKRKLKSKTKAAAWFVSNCLPRKRLQIAREIQKELRRRGHVLDIYGKCGTKLCPKNKTSFCYKKIEREYFFYLAFENSMGEDYVSEKLLNALQHYTVPIVYGGANYSSFMPDDIYLNASELSPKDLVREMVKIIKNKEKYYNMFKWHNHYSYYNPMLPPQVEPGIGGHDVPYCNLCKWINENSKKKSIRIFVNFNKWWKSPCYKRP